MKSTTKMQLIIVAITILFAVLTWSDSLVILDRRTVDWRLTYAYHQPNSKVILVGITDQDLEKFGPWPWPRDMHARIIARMNEQSPKVIGYNVLFSDPSIKNPEADLKLAAAMAESGKVVLPIFSENISDRDGIVIGEDFITPLPELMAVAQNLGHIVIPEDPDKIVRRVPPVLSTKQGNLDSISLAVAKSYLGISDETVPRKGFASSGTILIPVDEKGLMFIPYSGKPGSYPIYSVSDLLQKGLPDSARDSIILFGATATGVAYSYHAPSTEIKMSELEINANIVSSVLEGNYYKDSNKKEDVGIVLILGLICGLILPKLKPAHGFVLALGLAVIYLAFAFFTTLKMHYILTVAYPAMVIFLAYISNIAYGYILERKEKQKITQTFGKYVAPQIVQEILKSGNNPTDMQSRKQEATILFVDLSGFTPLSESLPPEQLVEILNKYLDMAVESIFKYEGTIDKFIGDAVMAEFNAPMPVADHQLKACQAALSIQEKIKIISEEVEASHGRKLTVTVGLNTGEVIVGNIGSKNRMEYAAIGDNVNIAARLQSLAKGGQIFISQSTYDAVKDLVEVNAFGPQKVKGKEQALEVYELLGLKNRGN